MLPIVVTSITVAHLMFSHTHSTWVQTWLWMQGLTTPATARLNGLQSTGMHIDETKVEQTLKIQLWFTFSERSDCKNLQQVFVYYSFSPQQNVLHKILLARQRFLFLMLCGAKYILTQQCKQVHVCPRKINVSTLNRANEKEVLIDSK